MSIKSGYAPAVCDALRILMSPSLFVMLLLPRFCAQILICTKIKHCDTLYANSWPRLHCINIKLLLFNFLVFRQAGNNLNINSIRNTGFDFAFFERLRCRLDFNEMLVLFNNQIALVNREYVFLFL